MRKKFKQLGPAFAAGGGVKAELKFMKDKGAPKSMIAAEKKEHGMPAFDGGGSSGGGSAGSAGKSRFVGHGAFNFGGKGSAKGKPFAMGGPVEEGANKNIDDSTRARALAAVERMRAAQDAEGAGDLSAAQPPISVPPIRGRARHAAAPVVVQKSTTVYSNEGHDKLPPAAREFADIIHGRGSPAPATEADAVTAANKGIPAKWTEQDQIPPAYRDKTPRYAGGGSIDGCASRGKTRGKVI